MDRSCWWSLQYRFGCAPTVDWIKAKVAGDGVCLWRPRTAVAFGAGGVPARGDCHTGGYASNHRNGVRPRCASAPCTPGLAASGIRLPMARASVRAGIAAAADLLDLRKGYSYRRRVVEDPDTDTPTRLEERPQVTLRLACLRDGAIMPYSGDTDPLLAWAQSEVSVAQYRIATCPVPAGFETAADAAKAQWGRWERDSPVVALAFAPTGRRWV